MPDDVVKDSLLSEFIARSGCDPALAWDLLNGMCSCPFTLVNDKGYISLISFLNVLFLLLGTNWDLDEGLRAYV